MNGLKTQNCIPGRLLLSRIFIEIMTSPELNKNRFAIISHQAYRKEMYLKYCTAEAISIF